MNEQALAELADRQAIVDVVIRYATGVDRRDWALYASWEIAADAMEPTGRRLPAVSRA